MHKFAVVLLITLTSCSSIDIKPPLCPGTREYDVQLCRGERIYTIPNPPYMALQRQAKCDACIDIAQNCYHGIPQQCRPKWQ